MDRAGKEREPCRICCWPEQRHGGDQRAEEECPSDSGPEASPS